MNKVHIQSRLRKEAKMIVLLLVILALPIVVFIVQKTNNITPEQMTNTPMLALAIENTEQSVDGVWNINTLKRIPVTVTLTTGASQVATMDIAIAYDPDVFMVDNTDDLICDTPLPNQSNLVMDKLGTVSFTCDTGIAEEASDTPIAPRQTVKIATIYMTPKQNAKHTTISFVRPDTNIQTNNPSNESRNNMEIQMIDAVANVGVNSKKATLMAISSANPAHINNEFEVSIVASSEEQIRAVDVVLVYDPEVLEPKMATQSAVFSNYLGIEKDGSYPYVTEPGKIRFTAIIAPESKQGIAGDDINVATISFIPIKKKGETSVTFEFDENNPRNDSNIVSFSSNSDILTTVTQAIFAVE